MTSKPRIPMSAQILAAMALGAVVGVAAGKSATPLGAGGKLIIQFIKTLAAPLLFFAILDAFLHMKVRARSAGWMVTISAINGALALALGLAISNLLRPGRSLAGATGSAAQGGDAAPEPINFVKAFSGYIPDNFITPFATNSIVSIILVAVLLGLALRRVKDEQLARGESAFKPVEDAIKTLFSMIQTAMGWVMVLAPVAVFGVVAMTVGEKGFEPFKGLAVYVLVVLGGLGLHAGVVYHAWLFLFSPVPVRRFWAEGKEAVAYSLGSSSSLATLPVTLQSLDRMGVSPHSARMAACVGTNLNNDGILLYEAMAVLIVAQAHGMHLPLGDQLLAAAACAVAGVGIAGVPDAGLISLALVLATVHLPAELLPLLLTVDWVLSRARAAVNVTSDMMVAALLDRFDPVAPGEETGPPHPADG